MSCHLSLNVYKMVYQKCPLLMVFFIQMIYLKLIHIHDVGIENIIIYLYLCLFNICLISTAQVPNTFEFLFIHTFYSKRPTILFTPLFLTLVFKSHNRQTWSILSKFPTHSLKISQNASLSFPIGSHHRWIYTFNLI